MGVWVRESFTGTQQRDKDLRDLFEGALLQSRGSVGSFERPFTNPDLLSPHHHSDKTNHCLQNERKSDGSHVFLLDSGNKSTKPKFFRDMS